MKAVSIQALHMFQMTGLYILAQMNVPALQTQTQTPIATTLEVMTLVTKAMAMARSVMGQTQVVARLQSCRIPAQTSKIF